MNRFLMTVLALPMLATAAVAQGIPPADGAGAGRQLEGHYFAIGLSVPINSYPDDTRRLMDDLASTPGVTRLPLDMNLAVYWPVADEHTLLGPAIDVTADNLSRGDESISYNVVTAGASARRYVTGIVGEGLYGRLDAGIAVAGISYRSGSESYRADGNVGFGGAAGAGWAFAVSSGTSIELTATALYRSLPGHETGAARATSDVFEKGSYVSGSFGVAVLW